MTRDEFWQLIDSTRPKGFLAALHAGTLGVKLETLPEEDIISFEHHFRTLMFESYRWDLWGAAYIVNGGCSDDGFEYFRAWLISQGERFYVKCLKDPEAIAARADLDGGTEDEEFMYCAAEAFREKTGRDLPPIHVARAPHPAGHNWEEADLLKLYPKLAKKFRLLGYAKEQSEEGNRRMYGPTNILARKLQDLSRENAHSTGQKDGERETTGYKATRVLEGRDASSSMLEGFREAKLKAIELLRPYNAFDSEVIAEYVRGWLEGSREVAADG